MSETRQYEVVYVVSPEITEEGVTELHNRIAEIVDQLGGRIDKTDNWGRRRLAYEINRHREGTYVIELVSGPGTLVTELDRRLRVMEQLLRHLIVRVDEDLRKAQRARERRQRRPKRRQAKKALAGLGVPADAPAAAPGSGAAGDAAPGPVTAAEPAAAPAPVATAEPAAAPAPVATAEPAAAPAPVAAEPVPAVETAEPAVATEDAAETAEVTNE
jgi:small subunit ribosomal protein S6